MTSHSALQVMPANLPDTNSAQAMIWKDGDCKEKDLLCYFNIELGYESMQMQERIFSLT